MSEAAEVKYLNFRPTLPVKDLEKSANFYRDIVGLTLITFAPEYQLAIFEKQGAMLALVQNEAPNSQVAYLYVKGVDALYETCVAKGVTFETALQTHPYGMRDFVLKDPDGHIIGIGEQVSATW